MTELKEYILARIGGIFKQPSKGLAHPYLVPGTGYANELWGWDGYWTAHALMQMFARFGEGEMSRAGISRERAAAHIKGCILNFLAAEAEDGYIPVMLASEGLFEGFFAHERERGVPHNQHLPFLCRFALEAGEFLGDLSWLDGEKLIQYLRYYREKQYNARTGLYVWQDDVMIGMDNNPTVFFRPPRCSADIFLNSFLYVEFCALARILEQLQDARAREIQAHAEALKAAINAEMWDERDGIYYSQDLSFYNGGCTVKGVTLHEALPPHWKAIPLKVRFWACFLPMYARICDGRQAEKMCRHLTENGDLFARCGIRTVAANEKMYSLAKSAGNPSNWLGAIWTVANFCVWKGLCRYQKTELAERLRAATEALLLENLRAHGELFESYHPDTGEPFMHPGFLSFNLLAVEMMQ